MWAAWQSIAREIYILRYWGVIQMKGAILEKGEKYYTYMRAIFTAIKDTQNKYNWLITDFEGIAETPIYDLFGDNSYIWISGEELTAIIEKDDFQWIWAVLSGFSKNIMLEEVLKHDFPYADGYTGFWQNPVTIQHPLADVEIVPWDSSLALIISKDDNIINNFRLAFPFSEDLEEHNTK